MPEKISGWNCSELLEKSFHKDEYETFDLGL